MANRLGRDKLLSIYGRKYVCPDWYQTYEELKAAGEMSPQVIAIYLCDEGITPADFFEPMQRGVDTWTWDLSTGVGQKMRKVENFKGRRSLIWREAVDLDEWVRERLRYYANEGGLDRLHETHDGRLVKVSEMDDGHLYNAIRYFGRHGQNTRDFERELERRVETWRSR